MLGRYLLFVCLLRFRERVRDAEAHRGKEETYSVTERMVLQGAERSTLPPTDMALSFMDLR